MEVVDKRTNRRPSDIFEVGDVVECWNYPTDEPVFLMMVDEKSYVYLSGSCPGVIGNDVFRTWSHIKKVNTELVIKD